MVKRHVKGGTCRGGRKFNGKKAVPQPRIPKCVLKAGLSESLAAATAALATAKTKQAEASKPDVKMKVKATIGKKSTRPNRGVEKKERKKLAKAQAEGRTPSPKLGSSSPKQSAASPKLKAASPKLKAASPKMEASQSETSKKLRRKENRKTIQVKKLDLKKSRQR
mmetsp:Transcript_82574/g.145708  ORF Transcript_82574/g.145708 Transcript_82574/m.145708 type:complete len:166 (-) Transcript_82574:77-574(-)